MISWYYGVKVLTVAVKTTNANNILTTVSSLDKEKMPYRPSMRSEKAPGCRLDFQPGLTDWVHYVARVNFENHLGEAGGVI